MEENRTQARQDEQVRLEGDGQGDLNEREKESVHVVPRAVTANFNFENQRGDVVCCHANESNEDQQESAREREKVYGNVLDPDLVSDILD